MKLYFPMYIVTLECVKVNLTAWSTGPMQTVIKQYHKNVIWYRKALCSNLKSISHNYFLIGGFKRIFSFSLCQVAPSCTHISPTYSTQSLIDLALLLNTEPVQNCTAIPPLLTSDHLGISLVLTLILRAAK